MVPRFQESKLGGIYWENEQSKLGVFISGKMNNLNWEYLFQGKYTYEMQDIFKSLLNKFIKQFIPMKKIDIIRKSNKWMNKEIKRLIRETKIAYQIQKNSSEENKQTCRQLLQIKKKEIRKTETEIKIEIMYLKN